MSENQARTSRRRTLQGIVVSDKMNKTRVVQIRYSAKHDKYHKVVKVANKFKAHDEKNESKIGDVVRMMETRPLSKDKRWIIREIVKKAEL